MSIAPSLPTKPAASTQKQLLLKRDAALRARFEELYKRQRLRIDDTIKKLENEFFITERTIRAIMKTDGAPAAAEAPAA